MNGQAGMQMGADPEDIRRRIAAHLGEAKVPGRIRTVSDTTDFYRVDYDDVLLLGEREFLMRNFEREGRFGIEEQPKFWVRRAVDLADGSLKVIKMVFNERFTASYGGLSYECVRSPVKEGHILEMVSGHPRFMQGMSIEDSAGNPVRVIDYIKGQSYPDYISGLCVEHEEYYYRHLPELLREFGELVRAVAFLHKGGQTHGDIRRDHIIRDKAGGLCRWIDFDYSCLHGENMFAYDMAGLGNILLFTVGGGDVIAQELKASGSPVLSSIEPGDMNVIFRNRVANLKKVYPYISEEVNYLLMHFSIGASVYYLSTEEFLRDLGYAIEGG